MKKTWKDRLRVWLIRRLGGQPESTWATEIEKKGLKPMTIYAYAPVNERIAEGYGEGEKRARENLLERMELHTDFFKYEVIPDEHPWLNNGRMRASLNLLVPERVAPEEVRDE